MKYIKIILILFFGSLTSCKKFVEIAPPKNSLVPAVVYNNNDLATSAVVGVYQQMTISGFASGDSGSISTVCGVSSDELVGYSPDLLAVFQNQITPEASTTNAIWTKIYARIYDANSILEGVNNSNGLTPPVKAQLKGEALFIRAFSYFYLVNLFGAVPLHLSSDYTINRKALRKPIDEVYTQILTDLIEAESLLTDAYITTERVRPNKATVHALLARIYLYLGDWVNAEKYTSLIIGKSSIYKLVNLNDVFLNNSLETIWQLIPISGSYTLAGELFILSNSAPTLASLRPDFANQAFELNDLRKVAWIKSMVNGGVTYYYPFKYKVRSLATPAEYFMVFRLAEQLLIRAEAKAQQGKLNEAIDDLDIVRNRAGLSLIKNTNPHITKENLLIAIQKERKIELFSEWGDRWFDLKRTGNSTIVLSPIKPNWKSNYVNFPIPRQEINNNPKIYQNDDY